MESTKKINIAELITAFKEQEEHATATEARKREELEDARLELYNKECDALKDLQGRIEEVQAACPLEFSVEFKPGHSAGSGYRKGTFIGPFLKLNLLSQVRPLTVTVNTHHANVSGPNEVRRYEASVGFFKVLVRDLVNSTVIREEGLSSTEFVVMFSKYVGICLSHGKWTDDKTTWNKAASILKENKPE